MGDFTAAARTSEFKDGSKKKVLVQGQEILLVKAGDRYYATANRCPHMGGDLSQGNLKGTVIICPRHASQFDLSDGKVVRWLKGSGLFSAVGKVLKSPRPLKIYNIEIKGDMILIEV